ncbi:hypothetical protein B6D60_00535 [candidate division KSB1 bacterium 4484_87]|nr:MAG: hypothetical protein B6D60_00535 [candidate division KSB1 bacterium 4484_87]
MKKEQNDSYGVCDAVVQKCHRNPTKCPRLSGAIAQKREIVDLLPDKMKKYSHKEQKIKKNVASDEKS